MHPLAYLISYNKFSYNHRACLAAISTHHKPKHFNQVVKDPKWKEEMKKEIKALEHNDTWSLEELPPKKCVIYYKWVYNIKYKPTGEVERYKARIVFKGFTQLKGVDFHETFALVAKLVTVRSLLAVSIKKN